MPHGFNSIALLNSRWCTSPVTQAAAASFSPAGLQLAQSAWNADTLRFQVSQHVLAGPNGVAYAQQIDAAVKTALSSGFVVDVSMQDESRACGPAEPLPGPETEAAWSRLISNTGLRTYPDVMFELLNEPQSSPGTTRRPTPASRPGSTGCQAAGRSVRGTGGPPMSPSDIRRWSIFYGPC